MIQLDFDAARRAPRRSRTEPTKVGYSSHEGAERADWGDDKLELVDGTHPVVYPAAGSHANKYNAALYLGSSADAGVGCDDTARPARRAAPGREDDSERPGGRRASAFPWITFEGRWGELQPAFYNGPTGPEPEDAVDRADRRGRRAGASRSYAVPTGGRLRHRRDGLLLQRGRDGLDRP